MHAVVSSRSYTKVSSYIVILGFFYLSFVTLSIYFGLSPFYIVVSLFLALRPCSSLYLGSCHLILFIVGTTKSKSSTIIISSYEHAGLNLDLGIIRAFEFSSDRLYVTPVEFSTKVTFQGYSHNLVLLKFERVHPSRSIKTGTI